MGMYHHCGRVNFPETSIKAGPSVFINRRTPNGHREQFNTHWLINTSLQEKRHWAPIDNFVLIIQKWGGGGGAEWGWVNSEINDNLSGNIFQNTSKN